MQAVPGRVKPSAKKDPTGDKKTKRALHKYNERLFMRVKLANIVLLAMFKFVPEKTYRHNDTGNKGKI